MKFEVTTEVIMKSTGMWRRVVWYTSNVSATSMDTASSETSAHIQYTKRRHIPENNNLHILLQLKEGNVPFRLRCRNLHENQTRLG
jgi:hypothetical protein